jgi:uncharacterized protein
MENRIENLNWTEVRSNINNKGYALVPGLLDGDECATLIDAYNDPALYRKTIQMERYRFGLGEYKYFDYPLPPLIETIRQEVYLQLAPLANDWMTALKIERQYPPSLNEFLAQCKEKGQARPTVLILKYGSGGHNTLHQDIYGDIFFPLQVVLFLDEPGEDYRGGEFVITEQVPRAQSKAIVLQPRKGDMLIFTTNFRPVRGTKGFYRVNMKHGVSEVTDGSRHTLGIIFHDALT